MARATDAFDDDVPVAETEEAGLAPASEGSTLERARASLRERRERALLSLKKDFEVPLLDGVFVRYKPITQAMLDKANKQASASKDPDASVIANAGILAVACIGVGEVVDGEPVSIDPDERSSDPDDWPRFDKRLARLLGVPAGKAADVVRGLYPTDGHIISTVTELGVWSGFANNQIERDTEGN